MTNLTPTQRHNLTVPIYAALQHLNAALKTWDDQAVARQHGKYALEALRKAQVTVAKYIENPSDEQPI